MQTCKEPLPCFSVPRRCSPAVWFTNDLLLMAKIVDFKFWTHQPVQSTCCHCAAPPLPVVSCIIETLGPVSMWERWPFGCVSSMTTSSGWTSPDSRWVYLAGTAFCLFRASDVKGKRAWWANVASESVRIWVQQTWYRNLWKLPIRPSKADGSASLDKCGGFKRLSMIEINKDVLFWKDENWC